MMNKEINMKEMEAVAGGLMDPQVRMEMLDKIEHSRLSSDKRRDAIDWLNDMYRKPRWYTRDEVYERLKHSFGIE